MYRGVFLDRDGNFNSKKYLKLLNNAKYAIKTGKGPSKLTSISNNDIVLFTSISRRDIWEFIHKLANFLSSGIDLKTAFGILSKQSKNHKLKSIINDIRINLDYGLSISDTLKQFEQYFSPLIISIIEVGEKTGNLTKVLNELDNKLLEDIELRSKIKSTLMYPIIVISITLILVCFLLIFVVPKITDAFIKTGVSLPALTQFVVSLSNFIKTNYLFVILGITGLIVSVILFKRTYYGQLTFGFLSIRVPVFGFIVKQENVILFINSFVLLLNSGVLMLEALEISANVVPNIYFKRDVIRIKNEVETGIRLSSAMGLNVIEKSSTFSNPYFPEDLVQMVSIGEETGTISKSIERVAINYSKELKRYIGNLMSLLEPFIIVFIGAIIGFVVIAIMLPFFELGKVVKKM